MQPDRAPFISIIVPAYNVEAYLDECMESIIGQSYANIEVILVDDGSTDATPQLCDAWASKDKRIHVIHTDNHGLSAARNRGFANATGEWIWFVDSDDYIVHDAVEKVSAVVDGQDCDLVAIDLQPFDETGALSLSVLDYEPLHYSGMTEGYELEKVLYQGKRGHYAVSYICRRDALQKFCVNAGPFDESIRLLEDVAFIYQYLKVVDKAAWIDGPLYWYRQSSGSLVHQGNAGRAESGLHVIEIISSLEVAPELEAYRQETIIHFITCIDTLAGDTREAREVRAKSRLLLKNAFDGKPRVSLSTSYRMKRLLVSMGLFHSVRKALIRLGLARAWEEK